MPKISVFQNFHALTEDLSLDSIVEINRGNKYKSEIENLRNLLQTEGKDRYRDEKKKLPAFTPSGTFSGKRSIETLDQYSGIVILDIDNVGRKLGDVLKIINDCPYTLCSFISPSGDGIKILVRVNTKSTEHLTAFNTVKAYYEKLTSVMIDPSGKDVSRLCFFSYDPDLHYYKEAKYFEVTIQRKQGAPTIDYHRTQPSTTRGNVEQLIRKIDASNVDLTANYQDWVNIGFALESEFGESGMAMFHQLSNKYSKYSYKQCEEQYNKCLRSKSMGVTISTLFHLAKVAGITIYDGTTSHVRETSKQIANESFPEPEEEATNKSVFKTPNIPSTVYENLPSILKETSDLFQENIEKDVFLIGALTVISGCLPNIEGIYFDEPYSAHLYAFITAPAGSGKGKLNWAKLLGQEIHRKLVEESIKQKEVYERELEDYNNMGKNQRQGAEVPKAPKRKMFFIPANSSSAAFIQALDDNDFKGTVFETEADTLAGTFKNEWGNFSDVLRKAFHHESTSMFRRKDNEYIEINDPHLAMVLSGTPKQVHNIMPDTENGLFSRFLYYAFEDNSDFKNPFISHKDINYTDFLDAKGKLIFDLNQLLLNEAQPIQFRFTAEQGEIFTEKFNNLYKRNQVLLGNDFNANSRRLGLITFRIAMVFRTLRILEDGELNSPLICSDIDFQTAIQIAFTLEKHAIAVFQNLPNSNLKGSKVQFYEKLPRVFSRQEYLSVASEFGIKDKTAQKYIKQFKDSGLLNHEHNSYQKAG